MSVFYKILFLLFVICSLQKSIAQDLKFTNIGVKEGLSQSEIQCLLQDNTGFVWFGTNNGLYKYDGYKFNAFRYNQRDTLSISDNFVVSFVEDRNYIWTGTRNGLNRFDKNNNTFKRYFHIPNDSSSLDNSIISYVIKDNNGNIWVAAKDLHLYNGKKDNFIRISLPINKYNPSANTFINSISNDQEGFFWICTTNGIYKFDPNAIEFLSFPFEEELNNNQISNEYTFFKEDNKQNYLIGSIQNGLFYVNRKSNKIHHYKSNQLLKNSLPSNFISHIMVDHLGNVWLSTTHGLSIIDHFVELSDKQDVFRNYYNSTTRKNSLNTNQVSFCLEDTDQRVWVAGRFGGVSIYDKYINQFGHYKFSQIDPKYETNNMTGILEDEEGNIWFGADGGGIYKWLRSKNEFKIYKNDPNDNNTLSNNKVLGLLKDSHNEIWVAMWAGGLDKYDKKNDSFIHYKHSTTDSLSLSNNNIFCISETSEGNLLLGMWRDKLILYIRENNTFLRNPYPSLDNFSVPTLNVKSVLEDSKGNIWISSELRGVFRIDKRAQISHQYIPEKNNNTSISSLAINTIFEDNKDQIWIGTRNGLNLYDRSKNNFKRFFIEDGLPSNFIVGILQDNNDNIWLSTTQGLARLEIIGETNEIEIKVTNFDHKDGLQGDLFNQWSSFKTSSGELIFGGMDGINIFNPSDISTNLNKPKVVITDFMLSNKSVGPKQVGSPLNKSIINTNKIFLEHDQSDISFEFASLNYTNPNKNEYAYKLEGFDDYWHYVGTSRKATYTNLDPGKYIFRVKGSNNNGVWNNGKPLDIIISPPYWGTIWFKILSGIIIISSILLFIKARTERVRKKNRQLENLVNSKTKELLVANKNLEKAKQEVATEKEELAITLKSIADAVVTTDINGNILLCNNAAEKLFKKSQEELIGHDLSKIIINNQQLIDIRLQNKFYISNCSEYVPFANEQLQITSDDDKIITVTMNSSIIRDVKNEITGLVYVLRDVTQKLELENQLALSQKMESIGHLAAGISHEINTPMQFIGDNTSFLKESFNSIISFINSLKNEVIANNESSIITVDQIKSNFESEDIEFLLEEIPSAIDQSQSGIERVSNIVRAMKEFSHPAKKEKAYNNLNHGIEVTSIVTKNEWKYLAELDLQLDDSLPSVYCLHDEMNQVILNMIVNAAHAINEKKSEHSNDLGKITIKTMQEDNYAVILIKDTGKGISEENLNKIFNPFFTTKEVGKGTGQGLSIAHDIIVNKHQGSISVDSELNVGTTFKIKIPIENEIN